MASKLPTPPSPDRIMTTDPGAKLATTGKGTALPTSAPAAKLMTTDQGAKMATTGKGTALPTSAPPDRIMTTDLGPRVDTADKGKTLESPDALTSLKTTKSNPTTPTPQLRGLENLGGTMEKRGENYATPQTMEKRGENYATPQTMEVKQARPTSSIVVDKPSGSSVNSSNAGAFKETTGNLTETVKLMQVKIKAAAFLYKLLSRTTKLVSREYPNPTIKEKQLRAVYACTAAGENLKGIRLANSSL